ncbi:family 16 glycosylhydrolase [Microvirga terricola]|uniref:Family 16 glycosylhydrolase n=1 Tax=Microvirga terricola TaxID=2719797 RepID=A0ABX0VCU6_9HYPH|nr:family 16 glycosylhydrolase [Microvirga terricola]NIX76186.1 family 16 glycosylhydrolase [Microvirga terricola]
MAIDPKNLAGTATLTFGDEFNSFSYWNGKSGTWDTGYPWTAANGGTNAGNNEEQWYINANYAPTQGLGTYSASNGIMNINAAPASAATKSLINGYNYTSGMITTAHSFSQTYGYFEMRAKLPAGQGLWPAFWLLPTDGSWPPEIDIMEVIGSSPNQLETTVHSNSGGYQMNNKSTTVQGMTTGFHTYGVDWEKDKIAWYHDGVKIYETATPADMNKPMYMLANLAVGGDWPGSPNSSTHFPATMQIDYIRAYRAGATPGGSTPGGSTDQPTPAPTPNPIPTGQKLFSLPGSAATTKTIIGTSAADYLKGSSKHNAINGKAGADAMLGGSGDDTYYVDHKADKVIESAGKGIDTVKTALASYKLSANVENLTLSGKTSQTGVGNELSNRLISNGVAANKLSGGAGNDILYVGKYADILTGGSGRDQFVFKSAPVKAGHITDFTVGVDVLDLRGLFVGYKGTNPVSDGRLSFVDTGAGDTIVKYKSAAGTVSTVTTLDHVTASQLHAKADYFWA